MQKYDGQLLEKFPSEINGIAAVGVFVEVRNYDTNELAPLFSDADGLTPKASIVTDSNGYYFFYAADGRYKISFSNGFPDIETVLGGGGGGGIEYDIPPETIAIGQTFFNPESFDLTFSYQDDTSTQYVTFPLIGSSVSTDGGGGGGTTTTLSNAGAIGLPLVGDLVGADYPIKRLEAGANVTIADNGTYYTIAAASGGGISDGNKGDITVSGAGTAWTLNSSGVVAGTYNNNGTQVRPFTVDAKGRITSVGAAVNITPAFSSLTSKPTTLGGYGITDAQPLDATLTALAALTTAANQIAYSTGSDAFAMTSLTTLARNLIAAATTSNMLATLGITVTTNANGISLRIPTSTPTSGIQLCFVANLTLPAVNITHGAGFTSSALSWTFPQAFSGVPYYNFSCDDDNNIMISGAGAATTSAACRGKAFISVATATPTFAFAIGTY